MVDVKEWDLFPTKIFESKFVANDEILDYVDKVEYNKHGNLYQSINNNLQNIGVFKPFINHIYSLRSDKTFIIISHKKSILEKCDRLLTVKNNKIIEA